MPHSIAVSLLFRNLPLFLATTLLLRSTTAQSSQIASISNAPSSTSTHPLGINPETTGTPTATALPGEGAYVYAGCYNETTTLDGTPEAGTRALSGPGSTMEGDDILTPSRCFDFCADAQYAGLQYSRECWCAEFPSSMIQRIDDSWCDMPCAGDDSVMCGGRLTISLYNHTGDHGEGTASGRDARGVVWNWGLVGILGVGVTGLL